MVVSANPNDVLVIYGLGSCVAVCLYDPVAQVGGVLHALLPNRNESSNQTGHPTKFVAEGVPSLVEAMLSLGARSNRLVAHLCGGAQMLTRPEFGDLMNIGKRNVLAAEAALQASGLKIRARTTGGKAGRTVKLYIASGQVTVKTLRQKERILV
jgi:chemotaxis protein CheD